MIGWGVAGLLIAAAGIVCCIPAMRRKRRVDAREQRLYDIETGKINPLA